MKIIALYLPQFHTIPENDEWWGKGFTEWVNVKKAVPLFKGHNQPKVPLNNNYYNLLNDDIKIWQTKLAKQYGIYGFCYYHYWYNGHLLLEKPMEQMLNNKNIDLPFCIWWCNQPWTKSWVGNNDKVLISQKYGDEQEWINHYNYLRRFFVDERYILNNNKPILGIYQPMSITCLKEIKNCWDHMAINDGFDGIDLMCTVTNYIDVDKNKEIYSIFDNFVEWSFAIAVNELSKQDDSKIYLLLNSIKEKLNLKYKRLVGHDLPINFLTSYVKRLLLNNEIKKFDYDAIWKSILGIKLYSEKSIPGAIVNWDNTARYGSKGSVIINASANKFEKYLSKQIYNAKNMYKKDMIFLQAWNEWAEWSVLEPDTKNKYKYLEAVKQALIENNEFGVS